jgi:hypothetical protein
MDVAVLAFNMLIRVMEAAFCIGFRASNAMTEHVKIAVHIQRSKKEMPRLALGTSSDVYTFVRAQE